MKTLIITIFCCICFTGYSQLSIPKTKKDTLWVINGVSLGYGYRSFIKPGAKVKYMKSKKAIRKYGLYATNGAWIVKTRKIK